MNAQQRTKFLGVFLLILLGRDLAAQAEDRARIGFGRLEGSVGFSAGHGQDPAFDGRSVELLIAEAKSRKCRVIMLEIESGGGEVGQGAKIVDAIVRAQSDGVTVIAWYGSAMSAASWIPFAARHAVSKSNGRCGGSVIYSPGPDGKLNAVDAKFASAFIANVKNAASLCGKSPILVDAIFTQSAEVWRTDDGTLSALEPSTAARCIDSASTVLNMDVSTARETGFAQGVADDRARAADVAGFPDPIWIDLNPVLRRRVLAVQDAERAWRESATRLPALLPELFRKIDLAITGSRISLEHYAQGQPGKTYHLRNSGRQARQDLRDFVNKKLRKSMAPQDFDPDIWLPSAEAVARKRFVDRQAELLVRVNAIMDLLDGRNTAAIDEAQAKRSDLERILAPPDTANDAQ